MSELMSGHPPWCTSTSVPSGFIGDISSVHWSRFNKPLPKDVGFSSFNEGLGGNNPPNPEKEWGYPEWVRDRWYVPYEPWGDWGWCAPRRISHQCGHSLNPKGRRFPIRKPLSHQSYDWVIVSWSHQVRVLFTHYFKICPTLDKSTKIIEQKISKKYSIE